MIDAISDAEGAYQRSMEIKEQRSGWDELVDFDYVDGRCSVRAFHGNKDIKDALIAQLEAHYWEEGKGCAVECTVHGGKHSDCESLYGIPEVLARLEEGIFELLDNKERKSFALQFIRAIPVGADLSFVWPKFAVWLMEKCEPFDQCNSVRKVKKLYERIVQGEKVTTADAAAAYAAADAASDAAYYAAYAAYAAEAAYAAYYAAHAVYYASDAAYAADAVYYASDAAYYAADADAQRDELLRLLKVAV